MPADSSVTAVADAFQKLTTSEQIPKVTKYGLWASWAALILLAACLIVVSFLVIDSERRAEEIRLQQSTDLVVQSLESRILGTAELLQKTSMHLMQVQNGRFPMASAELSATTLMEERREVTSIALVTRENEVIRSWTSSVSPTIDRRQVGARLSDKELTAAVARVFITDTSEITPLYTLKDTQLVYADLIVPTPSSQQVLVARVDLSRLLTSAVRFSSNDRYRFVFLENGNYVLEGDREQSTDAENAVRYEAPLTLLGRRSDVKTTIVGTSFDHALSATNKVPVFLVAGLSVMLALTLAWLFYYQRQQHRSHRLLAAEYSLRRAMSESAVVGLRVTDREGRIIYVNETFQKILGCEASDLLGQRPPYTYWLEDIHEQLDGILKAGNPTPEPVTFLARRKSGEVFHAEVRLSSLEDENGRSLGYIGALYDVTAQALAREEVLAANDRFTRVVQSLNSSLAVLSDSDELYFANRGYDRLFGRTSEGAVRLLEKLRTLPEAEHREGLYDETTERWFDVRVQPLVWTKGENARLMIATDITARRELEIAREQQLRRAEATQRLVTMGEMASSLAHELNQPLAAISNYAGGAYTMLDNGTLSNERCRTAFERIENQAVRAGKIIQRIRGFAKKTDAKLEPVLVSKVIQETMELANIQARKLNARLEIDLEEGLPTLRGDEVMLEQLLLNLLKNAMEAVFESDNHTIRVRVARLEASQNMVRFEVIDHGPGISDEEKARLFDAFYSTKSEGMGMGLNICRSIAELHGGRLGITDTPGGGATFSFTVPVWTGEA